MENFISLFVFIVLGVVVYFLKNKNNGNIDNIPPQEDSYDLTTDPSCFYLHENIYFKDHNTDNF